MSRRRIENDRVNIWVSGHADHPVYGDHTEYNANNNSGSRSRQGTPSGSSTAARVAVATAVIALVAAGLNLFTAIKPYTWLGAQIASADSADGNKAPAGRNATSKGLETPVPAAIAATTAVNDYFALAQDDKVDAMWLSLTNQFRGKQDKGDFYSWWGAGVVAVQGPYTGFGSQKPYQDPDGATWVQFAVRFKEHNIGAVPRGTAWVPTYNVYWYKIKLESGRFLIDASQDAGICQLDLTSLGECESSKPFRK